MRKKIVWKSAGNEYRKRLSKDANKIEKKIGKNINKEKL